MKSAERFQPQPLGTLLSGRHANALNAVRLVLAAAVIFSHAFPLGGWKSDPFFRLFHEQENLGGVAVIGFFAISGYLITKSGANKDVLQYMWARILRIFPAFWLVLLVAVLIVGPVVWLIEQRSLNDYFVRGDWTAYSYLTKNWDLSIEQWGAFDIFRDTTPYGLLTGDSVFNGSLWTLKYEWAAYLVVGTIVLLGAMRYARVLLTVIFGLVLLAQSLRLTGAGAALAAFPLINDPLMVNLLCAFLWGAVFAVFADRIMVDDRLGVLALLVTSLTLLFGGFGIVGFGAFAYFLFWLAIRVPNWIKRIGAKNDYSYGLYLYGFLVQQTLAFFGWHTLGYAFYTISALAIATVLAMISWHVLEKPALSMKDRGPGRGIRFWWLRLTRRGNATTDQPRGEAVT